MTKTLNRERQTQRIVKFLRQTPHKNRTNVMNLMPKTSPEPGYYYLITLLQEMANTADKVLEAGALGDEDSTRINVDHLRQLRANLYKINESTKALTDLQGKKEKLEIERLLKKIQRSNQFISAWSERYKEIIAAEEMVLSEIGRNFLIDQSLPAAWDWGDDIAIIHDNVEQELITDLQKRGQKTIVILCADYEKSIDKRHGLHYIKNGDDAYLFFSSLISKIPLRSATFSLLLNQKNNTNEKKEDPYTDLKTLFNNAWRGIISNKNTIEYFGSRWVTQGLTNLPIIAKRPPVTKLRGKLNGVPMVIISPGPSLDKNIKHLKELQGHALLVAPAQTAMALSKAGITPNIIVVADPSDYLYVMNDFSMEDVDALWLGVACHPTFYRKYSEKIYTYNVNSGLDDWISKIFENDINLGSGGSVSVGILAMGISLECNPIVLVGQDLALTDGRQYARDSADGNTRLKFSDDRKSYAVENMSAGMLNHAPDGAQLQTTIMAPGYYGGEVATRWDYNGYRIEMERIAEQLKSSNDNISLLNCTEGGAYIEGFIHMPLTEGIDIIKKSHKYSINLKLLLQDIIKNLDIKNRRNKVLEKLKYIKKALEKSNDLALQCEKIAVICQEKNSNSKELSKKELELSKCIRDSFFISLAFQPDISNAIQLSSNAKNLYQILDASRILYSVVRNAIPTLLPIVKKSILELEEDSLKGNPS